MSTRAIVRCLATLIALAAANGAIAVQRTIVASYGLAANTPNVSSTLTSLGGL